MPQTVNGVEFPDDASPQEIAAFFASEGEIAQQPPGAAINRADYHGPITPYGGPEDQPIEANPLLDPLNILPLPGAAPVAGGIAREAAGAVGSVASRAIGRAGASKAAMATKAATKVMPKAVARAAGRRIFGDKAFDDLLKEVGKAVKSAVGKAAKSGTKRAARKALGSAATRVGGKAISKKVAAKIEEKATNAIASEAGRIALRKSTGEWKTAEELAKEGVTQLGTAAKRVRPSQAMRGASGPVLVQRAKLLEKAAGKKVVESGQDLEELLRKSIEQVIKRKAGGS